MSERDPLVYLTPVGRLSFPALFQPTEGMPGDDGTTQMKYESTLLIPKTEDLQPLRDLIVKVAADKWGEKLAQYKSSLKLPIRDGAEKSHIAGYGPEVWFIRANSQYKPDVKDPQVRNITDESLVYPGCQGRLLVKPSAFEHANAKGQAISRGVKLGLFAFQKTGEGEPFGTSVDADDYLTPVAATEDGGW